MKSLKKAAFLALALIAGGLTARAGTETVDSKDSKEVVETKSACQEMGHFFLAVDGGADFAGNVHNSLPFGDIRSTTQATAGVKGGYIFAPFAPNWTLRTEADISWSGDNRTIVGNFDSNNLLTLIDATVGYRVTKQFEPYGGFAIGFSDTFARVSGAGDDSSLSLAYGPVGGVRYHLNEHWQLFGEYKYIWSDDKTFNFNSYSVNTHTSGDNIVTLGLAYIF